MLLLIKAFLKERQSANLQELSLYFFKKPETMRFLMAHWIRKGRVRYQKKSASCGTKCQSCRLEFIEIYQWVK